MTSNTEFMQTLTWSLLHFLWQGAAIAAIAAAFMVVLRKPASRYLVGITALVLMFASFIVTFTLISAPSAHVADGMATGASAAAPISFRDATAYSPNNFMDEQAAVFSAGDFAWIARGWLVGVFVFALRIAFGLLVLEYLRRRNLIMLPEALVARFRALQQRLGIHRVIRYCECHSLNVPAVIGLFRPIVLVPVRALTGLSPEQLDAVIAHELGHVKRFDVAVNLVQVIAETLFFFHPAVWWLNKRIRSDREDCCDDVAVAACSGTLGYARALATMATWRDVPRFAMAATGSPVATRVARLLGISQRQNGARAAGVVTASLALATALIAAGVSFGVTNPALAQVEEVAQSEPAAPREPKGLAPVSPVNPPAPAPAPNPPAPQSPPSFINEMSTVGLDNVDADELVAMKIHGITPDYVKSVRALGFTPDAHDLVAMKIHDITPEYVKGMRHLGIQATADDFIAMKVQDITPSYVRQMRAAGFDLSTHELIAMKVHEITPEYRKSMEAAGYQLSASQLIHAKVMDITPAFIQKATAHGFKHESIDQLIALKHADVF